MQKSARQVRGREKKDVTFAIKSRISWKPSSVRFWKSTPETSAPKVGWSGLMVTWDGVEDSFPLIRPGMVYLVLPDWMVLIWIPECIMISLF
jgi:hypothetical protein